MRARDVAAMLAVTLTAGGPATAAREHAVAPFAAHYLADWRTINVGTSDIVLRADAVPDHYLYTWTMTARGIFRLMYSNDVVQRSWFSVQDEHVRPERYRGEQGASSVTIDFDWDAGRVRGVSESAPVDLKLDDGTQDVMSIQIEVMLDLRNHNLAKVYHILDKNEIKDFVYTLEGPARIRTEIGELDTLVVASQRAGSNRVLRMWFAPSLGYVPVQAERSRDGKLEFAMRIKTLQR